MSTAPELSIPEITWTQRGDEMWAGSINERYWVTIIHSTGDRGYTAYFNGKIIPNARYSKTPVGFSTLNGAMQAVEALLKLRVTEDAAKSTSVSAEPDGETTPVVNLVPIAMDDLIMTLAHLTTSRVEMAMGGNHATPEGHRLTVTITAVENMIAILANTDPEGAAESLNAFGKEV